MRTHTLLSLLALLGLLPLCLTALNLDRGGLSLDFEALSKQRLAEQDNLGQNLIEHPDFSAVRAGGWGEWHKWRHDYSFIHWPGLKPNDPRLSQARKLVTYKVVNQTAQIHKPKELTTVLPPDLLKNFSSGWKVFANLPDQQGGTYRLSFRYRADHLDGGGSYALVLAYGQELGKQSDAKHVDFKMLSLDKGSKAWWKTFSQDIVLPPGSTSVALIFRFDGLGDFEFKNPLFCKLKQTTPVTLKLSPHGFLGGNVALGEGQPAMLCWEWKRNCPKGTPFKNTRLVLQLPPGIDFVDAWDLPTLDLKKTPENTTVTIDLQPKIWRLQSHADDFDCWGLHTTILTSSLKAGEKRPGGKAWIVSNGQVVSNVEPLDFQLIPPVKGTKPTYFYPGVHFGSANKLSLSPKGPQAMADIFQAAGVRWLNTLPMKSYEPFRKAGVEVIIPTLWWVANGYRVGDPKGRPEADRFHYMGTHKKEEMDMAACPSAIYEKRPFFQNSTVPYLRKILKGADGLWANWEPYMFTGRGCFCDTCRRKFADFIGVPQEQMKQEWPREVTAGGKYYQQIIRFRSLEHAKLVRTVDETVRAVTGGDQSFGFIPGTAYINLVTGAKDNHFDQETHPSDYLQSLKWLNPWGPYPVWKSHGPYAYDKAFSLKTFFSARDVHENLVKTVPPQNRPKLLALPHGIQLSDWVTYPEAMKLDILSFLFNGFRGVAVYAFPRGYDHRYWNAFAQATNIAAAYDRWVFKGKRVDSRIRLTPIQPYALPTQLVDKGKGQVHQLSMLQHVAYELNRDIIVPVFNFWLKGEAFFNLKLEGLEPSRHYRIVAQGNLFASQQGETFTGKQLAQTGVTLHAGAERCVVYEIIPAEHKASFNRIITPENLKKFREQGLPKLQKAALEDKDYEGQFGIPEKKELQAQEHAGITCTPDRQNNTLTFTSQQRQVVLTADTMNVTRWTNQGQRLIEGDKFTGFGAVAFWNPLRQIHRDFVVRKQEKITGGLRITAELRLNSKFHPLLHGLTLKQQLDITDHCRTLRLKSTFTNHQDIPLAFAFRYNMMPTLTAHKNGSIHVKSQGKWVTYARDFNQALYSYGDQDFEKRMRKVFSVTQPTRTIQGNTILFQAPGQNLELVLNPLEQLAGCAVWDSGVQTAATFEPCFKTVTLEPKSALEYTASLTLK